MKQSIISALEQTHSSILRHAEVVGLSNTNESAFRSLFLEHLCSDNPEARCQSEWKKVDLLVQFTDCNILIEFKYFLHRRSMNLDGSMGGSKGGATADNKRKFYQCVQQLHLDLSNPIHEKYIILVYEANAPSSRAGSYSDFYDNLAPNETIQSVERISSNESDLLKTVLITVS